MWPHVMKVPLLVSTNLQSVSSAPPSPEAAKEDTSTQRSCSASPWQMRHQGMKWVLQQQGVSWLPKEKGMSNKLLSMYLHLKGTQREIMFSVTVVAWHSSLGAGRGSRNQTILRAAESAASFVALPVKHEWSQPVKEVEGILQLSMKVLLTPHYSKLGVDDKTRSFLSILLNIRRKVAKGCC